MLTLNEYTMSLLCGLGSLHATGQGSNNCTSVASDFYISVATRLLMPNYQTAVGKRASRSRTKRPLQRTNIVMLENVS